MKYSAETTRRFDREFKKLDKTVQKFISVWMKNNLVDCDDPRHQGKAPKEKLKGFWRYRVGNYRIICDIQDKKLVILALSVGHRKEIYKHKK